MTFLITGGTGLIGSNLIILLLKALDHQTEHKFYLFTRDIATAENLTNFQKNNNKKNISIIWKDLHILTNQDYQHIIDDTDYVINLAGAPISRLPWTKKYKKIMISSRVILTQKISHAISMSKTPPVKFLTGSAIGVYGNYSDDSMRFNENSNINETKHSDFLQKMAISWETAAKSSVHNTNTIFLRTGLIFSKNAPLWQKLTLSYKLKISLQIKPETQILSWISLEDYLEILMRILFPEKFLHEEISKTFANFSGPINLVSPNPISWRDFSQKLSKKTGSFLPIPVPKQLTDFILKDASNLLNSGQYVESVVLEKASYTYRFNNIDDFISKLS